jgi:hypothetical protein
LHAAIYMPRRQQALRSTCGDLHAAMR